MSQKLPFLSIVVVTLALGNDLSAHSTLTKIADYNTVTAWTNTHTYTNFNNAPSVSGGNVYFEARSTDPSHSGIAHYRDGQSFPVASSYMSMPGGGGNYFIFSSYFQQDAEGSNFVFRANSFSAFGLFLYNGSSVTRVVANGTNIPGTALSFDNFGIPIIRNGKIAFVGTVGNSPQRTGIFIKNNGAITTSVPLDSFYPGGTGPLFLQRNDQFAFGGGDGVAFYSGDQSNALARAIIYAENSVLTKVVEQGVTLVPNSTNTFSYANGPWMKGNTIYFNGEAAFGNIRGVYSISTSGTGLTRIVDQSMTVPGTTNHFTTAGVIGVTAEDAVVFGANYGTIDYGIFQIKNGVITKIISHGDMVDGQEVQGVAVKVDPLSETIGLTLRFPASQMAIYTTGSGGSGGGFSLTRVSSPIGGGSILANPPGPLYASNTPVTVTATANVGFKFSHWIGLKTTLNPAIVTMRTNKSVTAVFTNLPVYLLSTNVNPSGAGSIALSPSSPSNTYPRGTVVTLMANANGTNQFAAWLGAGSFSNQVGLTMNGSKSVTALFNNPGQFVIYNTNGQSAVMFMQNTQRLGSVLLNNGLALATRWRLMGAGDFNNDGSKDILLWSTNGQVAAWGMQGNIRTSTTLLKSIGAAWRVGGVADFNNDGNADILWHNPGNGKLVVWQANGTTNPTTIQITNTVALGWRAAAAANFGGASTPDIVLQNTDGRVALWMMNGFGRSGSAIAPRSTTTAGVGFQVVGATDLDGNGHTDIIFQRSDGTLKVWYFTGTTFNSQVTLPSKVAPGWKLRVVK